MTGILVAQKVQILGASAVAVSCPVDTTEDILATINIPAGAMGLNGILRVTSCWTMTNSVNNKTMKVRLGGIGGTTYTDLVLTTVVTYTDFKMIQNRGAANSQKGYGNSASSSSNFSSSSQASVTSAIDTSAATTLVITGQKALNSETLTLESYLVELILP